jgi:dihydroorotase
VNTAKLQIHLRGGRIVDPDTRSDQAQDLFIAAGKIAGLGRAPNGFVADRVIDASGLIICPGLIDLSARLREPGSGYKANLDSEMDAAVAGGVTSLACPPDTDPPLDEPGLVEMLKHKARTRNGARLYPIGALTLGLRGERLTEMAELARAGCIAFSQAGAAIADTQVLMRAMQYAATFDFPVWLRPLDGSLSRDGVAHDGEVATRLGLPGIPACAETVSLATILLLARETGARVHLNCLSTAAAIEMVRQAKTQGLPVTCDVSAHQLHLSEIDVGYFDANCRLTPPLRSMRDRDALRAGLQDGTIDAVCSDHTPVDEDAKQLPFGEAEAGASGLELLLPLVLRWGREGGLSMAHTLEKITSAPARIAGLRRDALSKGTAADLCLFDPNHSWWVVPAALKSQGKNTPFIDTEMAGQVRYTLVDGQIAYEA